MLKNIFVGLIEGFILFGLLFASIIMLNVYNGTIDYYLIYVLFAFCVLKVIEHIFLKDKDQQTKILQIVLPVLISIIALIVLIAVYAPSITATMILILFPILVLIFNCTYEIFRIGIYALVPQEVN